MYFMVEEGAKKGEKGQPEIRERKKGCKNINTLTGKAEPAHKDLSSRNSLEKEKEDERNP